MQLQTVYKCSTRQFYNHGNRTEYGLFQLLCVRKAEKLFCQHESKFDLRVSKLRPENTLTLY